MGYIEVSSADEEYILRAKIRGNGGGPILAGIFYCATKALAYGGMIVAAGTAVGATGGGAIAIAGAGEVAGITGSGVAAAAIGSSVTATAAATAATEAAAVVASTSGIATVVAGVETLSCWAGTLGMAIPFL